MEQEKSPDFLVKESLEKLGIWSRAEWDVLVFLYRHQLVLASAEQIARFLGYPYNVAGDALDTLESHSLIKRSPSSQDVYLYQLVIAEDLAPAGFLQLITLTKDRAGRLLLAEALQQRGDRPPDKEGDPKWLRPM